MKLRNCGAVSVFLLLSVVTGAASAWAGEKDSAGDAPAKSDAVADFVAVGLPADWYRPFSIRDFLGFGTAWECVPFVVMSLRHEKAKVVVTTSGITGARLAGLSTHDEKTCPPADWEPVSVATTLHPMEQRGGWLAAPAEAFPLGTDPSKGALVIVPDKGAPVSLAISLRREPTSTVVQAVQWLVGIVVPLIAAGAITLWFTSRQKRSDQLAADDAILQDFTARNRNALAAFFAGLYQNTKSSDGGNARNNMLRELSDVGIVNALPAHRNIKLIALVKAGDWKRLDQFLANIFPDHTGTILNKAGGQG